MLPKLCQTPIIKKKKVAHLSMNTFFTETNCKHSTILFHLDVIKEDPVLVDCYKMWPEIVITSQNFICVSDVAPVM